MKDIIKPYFNPLVNIIVYVALWILWGALMYAGICLTEDYVYIQVSCGALWFCGFLLASLLIAIEIGEMQRIRKLRKHE